MFRSEAANIQSPCSCQGGDPEEVNEKAASGSGSGTVTDQSQQKESSSDWREEIRFMRSSFRRFENDHARLQEWVVEMDEKIR